MKGDEPVFPGQWMAHIPEVGNVPQEQWAGISKRDWLAAMAMQGMLANPKILDQFTDANRIYITKEALRYADEFLK